MPTNHPLATAAVHKLADQLGVALASVTGTGVGGRITVDDVRATARPNSRNAIAARPADAQLVKANAAMAADPAVRALADQLGIALTGCAATGPDGRITPEDVRARVGLARAGDPNAAYDDEAISTWQDGANTLASARDIRSTSSYSRVPGWS